ncbi:hypothetical protein [Streptosporangium sp. NPDC049046]|uniref:hypothetical protein n=1 Tax=Streptosporangium sp. NPDC049046 TaxID=3155031 RepID=UPI003433F475
MFAVRDELMEELYSRLDVRDAGFDPTFFRLHVVDMVGVMDVEVGVVAEKSVEGNGRVSLGTLSAGR